MTTYNKGSAAPRSHPGKGMTAPKNGRPVAKPAPAPVHPIFVKAIVQVVGVVVRDGKATEVASPQVAITAEQWAEFSAGLIAGFEAQEV